MAVSEVKVNLSSSSETRSVLIAIAQLILTLVGDYFLAVYRIVIFPLKT